jgi:urease accessory protein
MTIATGARPRDAARAGATPGIGWNASLSLRYAVRNGRTVLVENRHAGPLVVQKPLYPDDDAHCQTVIVHPPGGIAGGDRLAIDIDAGDGSQLLLTTPGATRWYKSNGKPASQRVRITAGVDATVEWMPLETIVFDRADALSMLEVDVAAGGRAAGWEIVAFGRGAAGERFSNGRFCQRIEIRREGRLLWAEYGDVAGADSLFASPIGYSSHTVSGLLWAACAGDAGGPSAAADMIDRGTTGVTRLPDGIMLARCLGDSTEDVKARLQRIWEQWRPLYAGRPARPPRLWAT